MRDLGICPLVVSVLLFGSRHLNNVRLMSPATRPAANGALRGAVVRDGPSVLPLKLWALKLWFVAGRFAVGWLGPHPFDHLGQPTLRVAKPSFNGHQLR
jgi:hypothetical protein